MALFFDNITLSNINCRLLIEKDFKEYMKLHDTLISNLYHKSSMVDVELKKFRRRDSLEKRTNILNILKQQNNNLFLDNNDS
jgi:hypothetical protein